MSKNPCVLWYWNDWAGGTAGFTPHEKGCYMNLLHAQFNLGHLEMNKIKNILSNDFGKTWPALKSKFSIDEHGKYFNERLEESMGYAASVSKRQSDIAKKRWEKSEPKKEADKPEPTPQPSLTGPALENALTIIEVSSHIETIAMRNKLTVDQVKNLLRVFRPKADLEYRNNAELIRHFSNFVAKNEREKAEKQAPVAAPYVVGKKRNK